MMHLFLLACGTATSQEAPVALTPSEVLDRIVELTESFPVDVGDTSKVGSLRLESNRGEVTAHIGNGPPGFSRVWVQNHAGGQRLDVDVALSTCVSWDAAKSKLVFAAAVPAHPGAPAPALDWWQYPQVSGLLLSISFDDNKCARTARLEPSP